MGISDYVAFVCILALLLLFLGFVGYLLWASLSPRASKPARRKAPEFVPFGSGPPEPVEQLPPDLVLQNDRREYDLAEIARAIGFEPVPPHDWQGLLTMERLIHRQHRRGDLSSGYSISAGTIHDAVRRRHGAGLYTIFNLEWTETLHRRHNRDETRSRAQTVILYEGPSPTHFPQFGTQRRTLQTARLLPILRLFNPRVFQEARVADDPEFTEKIYVGTALPESVRPLLTPQLRKLLARDPDLTVTADGNFVAVFRRGSTTPCLAWPRSSFLHSGLKIIGALRRAEEHTRAIRPAAFDDARRALRVVPWWDRGRGQGDVLSTAEIDNFLTQPPPRRVPRQIRRAQLGYIGYVFYGMGAFVLAIAGFLGAIAVNLPQPRDRTFGLVMVSVGALFGLTAVAATWLLRSGWLRLLRRGECRQATVVNVRPTSETINNQRQYLITFRYADAGVEREVSCPATEREAARASRVKATSDVTQILVDPNHKPRAERRAKVPRLFGRRIIPGMVPSSIRPRHTHAAIWLYGMAVD